MLEFTRPLPLPPERGHRHSSRVIETQSEILRLSNDNFMLRSDVETPELRKVLDVRIEPQILDELPLCIPRLGRTACRVRASKAEGRAPDQDDGKDASRVSPGLRQAAIHLVREGARGVRRSPSSREPGWRFVPTRCKRTRHRPRQGCCEAVPRHRSGSHRQSRHACHANSGMWRTDSGFGMSVATSMDDSPAAAVAESIGDPTGWPVLSNSVARVITIPLLIICASLTRTRAIHRAPPRGSIPGDPAYPGRETGSPDYMMGPKAPFGKGP